MYPQFIKRIIKAKYSQHTKMQKAIKFFDVHKFHSIWFQHKNMLGLFYTLLELSLRIVNRNMRQTTDFTLTRILSVDI